MGRGGGGDRGGGYGGGGRDRGGRGGDRDRGRDNGNADDRDRGHQGGGQRIQRDQDRGDRDHGNPKRMKMQDKMMHPDHYGRDRDMAKSGPQRIPRNRQEDSAGSDRMKIEQQSFMDSDGDDSDNMTPLDRYRMQRYIKNEEFKQEIDENPQYHSRSQSSGGAWYNEAGSRLIERDMYSNNGRANANRLNPLFGNNQQQQRILERIRGINQNDVVAKKFEVKKYTANTRLYIGNIANEVTEDDLKEIFKPFGELDELFLNRDKNFAFLKLDYRTSAEKARSELDGHNLKGRQLKVRFAPACVRLKVKNLAPTVSNELLEIAFSVFGEVERALVFVDDKGKSIGEGIVDFTRKNFALAANKFCGERCYFLSSELRPVETELGEMYEMDEGLLEANLNSRQGPPFNRGGQRQDQSFQQSREMGPRVADEGSFEHEYGLQWKKMMAAFRAKEAELKQEFELELDNLYKKMELAKYDYETEMLRRQLKQREMDQERARMEYEQRMQGRGGGGGGGGGNRQGYHTVQGNRQQDMDQGNRFDYDQDRGANQRREFQAMMAASNLAGLGVGMDLGMPDAVMVPLDNQVNPDSRPDEQDVMLNPLAPPPMPPQGLMDLETGIEIGSADVGQQQSVTWELGPFSGNFGNQSESHQNEGGPSPGFGGSQKIYRDRPSRFSDAGNEGGGSGGGSGRGSYNRGRGNYRGGHNSGRIPRR